MTTPCPLHQGLVEKIDDTKGLIGKLFDQQQKTHDAVLKIETTLNNGIKTKLENVEQKVFEHSRAFSIMKGRSQVTGRLLNIGIGIAMTVMASYIIYVTFGG